jgi:hypothetical protein
MLPEVSEWTGPLVYRLQADAAEMIGQLDVEGGPRIADATFHARDGLIYLFGNDVSDGSGVLRLWTAPSLFDRFSEHPASPIRISPAGARMAGALLDIGGRTYRLGQDGSRGYGKGILLFEVTALSASTYRERPAAGLSFSEVSGPHTFNRRGDLAVFDFYRERFSLLAGFHRVRAHLAKRKAAAAMPKASAG